MMAFTALAALGQGPWQGDMNAVIASCSEYTYLTPVSYTHLDVYKRQENVYLYTITEFTHLFVDIKHMRPVTEMPVVDRTFQF